MNTLISQRKMSDSLLRRPFPFLLCWSLLILWNSVSESSAVELLPYSEVSSLRTLLYQFKTKPAVQSISRAHCNSTSSSYGFAISCNKECYDKPTTDGDAQPCHITQIIISGLGLTGTIDASIGDLSWLTVINLSNNKLRGPIPDSLGNLINLRSLDLTHNQLSGTLPDSLGNLQSLQWLYLRNNFLSGVIPSSFSQLSLLRNLFLDYNMLSGSLPKKLGMLQNLTSLSIGENRLTGTLPPELGNLTSLTSFWLPSNYLSGKLPNFENLTNLERFVVAGNQLSGQLPSYVQKWPNLQNLGLQGNNFEGPLPDAYFQMPYLDTLLISDLNDTSDVKFPQRAINLPNIYRIVLRNCKLTGTVLDYVGQLSTLKHLDLSFNKLKGSIPESFTPNLIYLSLARNMLSGRIPNWIFQSTGTRMDLSYNNFSTVDSPVPTDVDLNLFACCCCDVSAGTKPFMLQPVDMMNQNFPKKKSKFYSLFINSGGEDTISNKTRYDRDNDTSHFHISAAQNWAYSFTGDFLVVTANSSDYTKRVPCKISDSGSSVYDDARLSPVSLNYYGFSLYTGTYDVTLHFAEIVYVNDEDYNLLRKRVFDIYIQGELVVKDFNIRDQSGGPNKATTLTFETEVNEDTNHILDIHLYWTGKGSYSDWPAFNGPLISAISVNPRFDVSDGKLKPWQIALIVVASLIFALLLLLAVIWSMGWLENEEFKDKVKVGEYFDNNVKKDIHVPLKKLVEATENFSNGKMIGKAGFLGAVYRAEVLKEPNIVVAVKKLHPRHKGKITGLIKKEISHMTMLQNDNIIKLLHVHIGKDLQLLVYEYMENESIETALFHAKMETIPWEKRLAICVGVARGLEFLHKHPGKIVHGKIKASNILLDRNYEPKLSDFGFASVYTEEDQFAVIKEEAPRGYLAHEYCQGDNPTAKTDIYSFGVLLIEIVAGRKNKEVIAQQETTDLVNEVHEHFNQNRINIKDLVDKKFADDHEIDEQAEEILQLAVKCTSQPGLRPDISEVVKVLNSVNKKAADEKWPVKVASTAADGSGSSA